MEPFSGHGKEDDQIELPPGFRFHPTDEELITHYLSKRVLDSEFSARAIGEVDLNKVEPWELPCMFSPTILSVQFFSFFPDDNFVKNCVVFWSLILWVFSFVQIKRKWGKRSGTFSALGTRNTQPVWEQTGLRRLVTGKPPERIRRFSAENRSLGWRKPWFSTREELRRERKPTGSCMNTDWKEDSLSKISPKPPR